MSKSGGQGFGCGQQGVSAAQVAANLNNHANQCNSNNAAYTPPSSASSSQGGGTIGK